MSSLLQVRSDEVAIDYGVRKKKRGNYAVKEIYKISAKQGDKSHSFACILRVYDGFMTGS